MSLPAALVSHLRSCKRRMASGASTCCLPRTLMWSGGPWQLSC